jgi:hypothetical protein
MREPAEAEARASHAAEATIDATTKTRTIDNTRIASIDRIDRCLEPTSQQFKEMIRANLSAGGYYRLPTAFHKGAASHEAGVTKI